MVIITLTIILKLLVSVRLKVSLIDKLNTKKALMSYFTSENELLAKSIEVALVCFFSDTNVHIYVCTFVP